MSHRNWRTPAVECQAREAPPVLPDGVTLVREYYDYQTWDYS